MDKPAQRIYFYFKLDVFFKQNLKLVQFRILAMVDRVFNLKSKMTIRNFLFKIAQKLKIVKQQPVEELFMNYVFTVSGVCLNSENRWARIVWNVFRTIMAMHYLLFDVRFMQILRSWSSFETVFHGFNNIFGCTIIYFRLLVIWNTQNVYRRARQFARKCDFEDLGPQHVEIRTRGRKIIRGSVYFFMTSVTAQILSATLTSPNYAPIAFPINLTQLSPAMKRTVRKIYESLLLVYSHLGSVNFLAIFIPMIELLCELKIIRNSFAGIFQNKPRYPSSKSAQTTFWIMTQSRINRLVQRHSDIIGELKSFEKLTRTSFLIIYYTAMLYVSMTIIAILNVQSFSMATIFLLEHILRMIVECYVFCHLATKLNEAVSGFCS